MIKRRQLFLAAAGSAAVAAPWAVRAQAADTLRLLVGFPAGSTPDVVARRVAERLVAGSYAPASLVDNRSGAGGQLAVSALKDLPANGLSVLLTPMSVLGIFPHTYRRLPYNPAVDVTPVAMGVSFDYGFAVGPLVPESVRSIADFTAWVKANPDKGSFGSPAAGSPLHFTGIMLGRAAGIELNHVAYRGSQAAIQDLLGGSLPALCSPLGELLRHLPGGKLRVIGTSGARRSRFAPQVPTFTEQRLRDMVFSEWYGFFLPGKASADTVQRLGAALRPVLAAPEFAEAMAPFGLEPAGGSPADLAAALKADSERWAPIIKSIGFTADS